MDASTTSSDASIPITDASVLVTEASNELSDTSPPPSNISGDEVVELTAKLETLNFSVIGSGEAKSHPDKVVQGVLGSETTVVNEGTGAANETVGGNTILMAPGITKMLAKAAVRTRFERSMKETAENLAKDKDVAGAELLCTMCMKLGTAFCNGCQRARYCSAECQRADWPVHKKLCKDFKSTASEASRPSLTHRLAIYFCFETNKIDLIWVDFFESEKGQMVERDSLVHDDLEKFLKVTGITRQSETDKYYFMNNAPSLLRRRVPHALIGHALIPDEGASKILHPALVNQTINNLARPGHLTTWIGPLMAFACFPGDGSEESGRTVKDVTPRDVRHAIDFLQNSHGNPCVPDPARYHGKTLSAVKVSDTKERYNIAMGVTDPIEPVNIPLDVYGLSPMASTMAFRLGLSWYIRRTSVAAENSNPFYRNKASNSVYSRWHTGDLRWLGHTTTLGPNGNIFHTTADQHVGSVVIYHGKGAALDPLHIMAFNSYHDAAFVAKEIPSREGLEKHWAAMKKDASNAAPMVSRLPSPFKLETKAGKVDFFCANPEVIAKVAQADGIWEEVVGSFGNVSTGLMSFFAKAAGRHT